MHPYGGKKAVMWATPRGSVTTMLKWDQGLVNYWSHLLFNMALLPISTNVTSAPIFLLPNFLISTSSYHPSHFLSCKSLDAEHVSPLGVRHLEIDFFLTHWQWIKTTSQNVKTFTVSSVLQSDYYITKVQGKDKPNTGIESLYLPAW